MITYTKSTEHVDLTDLLQMPMHSTYLINEHLSVFRVPGGWLYYFGLLPEPRT